MRARRRKHTFPFGWLSAFSFHSLLLATGIVLCLMVSEMRTAMGVEFAPSRDALSATQEKLGEMFSDLVPEGANRREYWASRVDQEIRANDLVSARGFLLAAPYMLDRRDKDAITAAAATKTDGGQDDRLLNAAKLFLPDDVRARYERATAPVVVPPSEALNTPAAETPTEPGATDNEREIASEEIDEPPPEPQLTNNQNEAQFFVLGSPRDLAFQSAGWIRGDRTDVFSLSISGLGLVAQEGLLDGFDPDSDFYKGASLVKSAIRAGRLNPGFENGLRAKLERALPAEALKANLQSAFTENSNILIATDVVFAAFAKSINVDRLEPLAADFEHVAVLADRRTTTSALTLLETVNSQRDLKRAELVSMAGGDSAITLAKLSGADTLNAATTLMDWTMQLIVLIIMLAALTLVMGWLSVGTFLRSLDLGRSTTPSVPLY